MAGWIDDDSPLRPPVADALARQRWGALASPGDAEKLDVDWTDDDAAAPVRRGRAEVTGWKHPPIPEATEPDEPLWQRALNFGREHMAVLAVALVVGLVFAVSTFLRARPTEVPLVPAPTEVVSVSAEPTPSQTPSLIKVHVLGAVATPGVVTLQQGARVEDAIAAAGGLLPDADPAQLNLAAVLADGSQIVIGTNKQPQGDINGAGSGGSGGGALVNLNTATQTELESLPGIGPVTAQKILTWRSQHGRFATVAELQEVDGIGPKTMAQLEPYVCV